MRLSLSEAGSSGFWPKCVRLPVVTSNRSSPRRACRSRSAPSGRNAACGYNGWRYQRVSRTGSECGPTSRDLRRRSRSRDFPEGSSSIAHTKLLGRRPCVSGIVLVNSELDAIEAIQPVFGAEPDVAAAVLEHAEARSTATAPVRATGA